MPSTEHERAVRDPSLLDAIVPLVTLVLLIGGSLALFGLNALDGPIQVAQEQARIDARVAEALHRSEPAAAGPARTVDELHAQLRKLGELKQAGLLTDDEFAQQKARLLAPRLEDATILPTALYRTLHGGHMPDRTERRVAIACQGGGSHTAFTAGVLSRLLTADDLDDHRVVGLSGTSGGAVCALLAWSALQEGEPHKARKLLEGFWAGNSASTPVELAVNAWLVWASTLQSVGLLPSVSPYDLPVNGLDQFRELLRRWVDFDRIEVDEDARHPLLLIGAVDVLSGRFRAFHSRRDRITADMVLASAAIPTVFPTVHTDGGAYWDGLFSQNPPVRELLEAEPDELWVIQINPTERATEPRTILDIADRRNELSGNLSLYQELHVIEKIDQLLADGLLIGGKYKQVTVRVIELDRPRSSQLLGPTSKLNRDSRFILDLMRQGEHQAEQFLTALAFERAWRRKDVDAVAGFLADGAELESIDPFPEHAGVRGQQLREVLSKLCRDVRLDLTRKQLTRDQAAWTVRVDGAEPVRRGRVDAKFHHGQLVHLRIGPAAG